MRTVTVLGLALALSLLAFPLVSIGTTQDTEALWWVGAALLLLGGLIPPVSRFVLDDGDNDNDDDEE